MEISYMFEEKPYTFNKFRITIIHWTTLFIQQLQ